ncbi:NAD(P)-dependent oxidoreductase [Bifidobacterium sp. SO4]|uniref:NAD(P)-dependent oxidoreductase n=1 Tax=Bifidobacterium sp. SO4 TaxID=2809030 RepID=UPI001BDDB590|nr:NAD(P)-dependent oxidoreductase [Bifidobacterium sp. SO4]MBT1169900.1 D-2-hydroxyacid dehydrogenase family protein [Bifidobacterium sp. SO4]
MTEIYETQPERTDLPLVVMPAILDSMVEPLKAQLPVLKDVARVRLYLDFTEDADLIAERTADADVMINGGPHLSDELLRRLSGGVRGGEGGKVGCIVFSGTGVASYINLALARELGVRICNAVHYGDNAVAEHTFALLLELVRHVGELSRGVKSGVWANPHGDGLQLAGRRLGIIGLGGIGSTVARIARAFGMDVAAWRTSQTPAERFEESGAAPVDDLNELIASSDVVSVHMPLIDGATRGLITADNLAHMKPGTLFINTARAEVIAPGALVARLQQGDIPAALDVYDHEPLPADDPLRAIPGIVLTPHVGWRTDGAFKELTRQMVACIAAYFAGDDLNVVVSER